MSDKSYKDDPLYKRVKKRYEQFEGEANKHKELHRVLWLGASIISVIVAMTSAFEFSIYDIESRHISTFFALLLPLVTGYVVLRNPEKLWILETTIKNRLKDLCLELEFQIKRNPHCDREVFEKKFLVILAESNERWADIKQGAG